MFLQSDGEESGIQVTSTYDKVSIDGEILDPFTISIGGQFYVSNSKNISNIFYIGFNLTEGYSLFSFDLITYNDKTFSVFVSEPISNTEAIFRIDLLNKTINLYNNDIENDTLEIARFDDITIDDINGHGIYLSI